MGFEEVVCLYDRFGDEKYLIGEDITQKSHALQAAHIAKICGAPMEVVIGLLLHDLGQLIGQKINLEVAIDLLHTDHDDLGREWLEKAGFDSKVYNIAQYHTLAKVILCEKDPEYFNKLSPISQQSYVLQKEKYKNTIDFLDQDINLEEILACRLIDDMAKIPQFLPGKIEDYTSNYYEVLNLDSKYLEDKSKLNKDGWTENVKLLYQLENNNKEKFLETIVNYKTGPYKN